jgi:hypothetical protein
VLKDARLDIIETFFTAYFTGFSHNNVATRFADAKNSLTQTIYAHQTSQTKQLLLHGVCYQDAIVLALPLVWIRVRRVTHSPIKVHFTLR